MSKKGYTLVEILVGMSLFAMVFTASGVVLFSTLKSSRKSSAIAMAKSEGAYALRSITDLIRYSEGIRCDAATGNLEVTRKGGAKVTYQLITTAGIGRIASDSGSVVSNLTSDKVDVVVPASVCGNLFTCINSNQSVKICFEVDKAGGVDVTDQAQGTGGIVFKTQVALTNTFN